MKSIGNTKKNRYAIWLGVMCLLFNLTAFAQQEKTENSIVFKEVFNEFPRVEKNLRKWDAPVVADLDVDGYPDLILNDHGLGISICWNNKGKFAKPFDLIMGDLHGVTVGDFDFDGNIELVLSRGGGSGSNARNSKMYRVTKNREFTALPDFEVPLELMRGRTVTFFDGDNDGDLDLLNFAFPSEEKKDTSENYVYQNNTAHELILVGTLPAVKANGQKTLLTDFNGDHIFDVILYGDGKVKAYQGKGDLTYVEVTEKLFPFDLHDVTGIAELDFDNDGDFDVYVTRGKEFEIGETYLNQETKTWGFFTKRGNFQFDDLEVGEILQLQNMQSQWPYNDAYYIGESAMNYNFPGETHSGKNIRLVNSNALGFPDKLNEDGGIHIGYVGNDKWRIAGNTWSPTTGVVQGVASYPAFNHQKGLSDVLLENKNGKFIDVTKSANLYLEEHTVGVSIADFDNNGMQDILVIKRGELVFKNESILYLNQGKSTFKRATQHGILTNDAGSMGMAVEVLDFDLDGTIDVVLGDERGKWHLFKNTSVSAIKNKKLRIQVGNSPLGKATASGALVQVKTCHGLQTQTIGATGAQYSLSNNTLIHFGLGDCSRNLKLNVIWTNGETVEKTIQSIDDIINIGS